MRQRVSISEIARLAQVSKGTVSKVLNSKPGVGPETRKRVMELADRLGYYPDASAQALSYGKSSTIGLLAPHTVDQMTGNQYWLELILSVTQRANDYSYRTVLFTSRDPDEVAAVYKQALAARQIDGLVIASDVLDKMGLASLYERGTPFVMIGRNPEFAHVCVDVNNRDTTFALANYMIERKYPRVALLVPETRYFYSFEREEGYRDAMAEKCLDTTTVALRGDAQQDGRTLRAAAPHVDGWLISEGGEFFSVVFEAFVAAGLDMKNFGITIFDDWRGLDFVSPPLTAARQPVIEMGTVATDHLITLMSEGDEKPNQTTIIPTTIIPRKSCGETS